MCHAELGGGMTRLRDLQGKLWGILTAANPQATSPRSLTRSKSEWKGNSSVRQVYQGTTFPSW